MPESSRRSFDPFDAIPAFDGVRHMSTARILFVVPPILVLVFGAAAIDGTIGSVDTSRLTDDVRLALGASDVDPSPSSFPLLRDLPSFLILGAIVATLMIVHRQWQLMAVCVEDLEANGAIIARAKPLPSRLFDAADRRAPDQELRDRDALDAVMRQARAYVRFVHNKLGLPLAVFAAAAGFAVMLGERHELFAVLAPDGWSEQRRQSWISETYRSWWAGMDNPAGAFVYFALAMVGLYVVVMQNMIGMVCIYFVLVLERVARIDADWLSRDGCFGWSPIARVFRTVCWSLIIHALALTVIIVAVGATNAFWIAPLVAIWIVVAPLYIGGSVMTFRRVGRQVRERRVERLQKEMGEASITVLSPTPELAPYTQELDRTTRARIRPLRLGTWRASIVIGSYILPIVLLVVQLAAQ